MDPVVDNSLIESSGKRVCLQTAIHHRPNGLWKWNLEAAKISPWWTLASPLLDQLFSLGFIPSPWPPHLNGLWLFSEPITEIPPHVSVEGETSSYMQNSIKWTLSLHKRGFAVCPDLIDPLKCSLDSGWLYSWLICGCFFTQKEFDKNFWRAIHNLYSS